MAFDRTYQALEYRLSELDHDYGNNVHLLSDPFLLSHLAILCHPETAQPSINTIVQTLYSNLVKLIVNNEFPRVLSKSETRMAATHGENGYYYGEIIDPSQKAVSVNLARAGTYPSHVCYDALNYILNPEGVRQDHISIFRATDKNHQVTGSQVSGYKIGGSVKKNIVLFPDPMGATGSTILSAVDLYKKEIDGPAQKFIAVHLIVTPEYLKKVQEKHPDLIIYAVRLDRGLSSDTVLNSKLGAQWDKEKGLNEKQYIVPGGGGFGEVLNNSYV